VVSAARRAVFHDVTTALAVAVCCRYCGTTAHRGAAPTFPRSAMSFVLLRRIIHGWTDHHGPASAEFPTEDAARSASIELDATWKTASEWRIVPTAELGNYEVI
jgi:hypothetical protein